MKILAGKYEFSKKTKPNKQVDQQCLKICKAHNM